MCVVCVCVCVCVRERERESDTVLLSKSHLLLLSDEQQESHWSREQQELSDTVIFHSINE